jgi:hypothetical protein
LIGFRLAIAAQQVDEADGQEISVVLSRLSAAAYLSRYAAPLEPRTELQVSKPALYLEAKRHLL